MMRYAPWLIALLGAVIVGYGLLIRWKHPPRIVGFGEVRVTDPKTGRRHVLSTREVEVAGFRKTEVLLPGGTWIDCAGGDCAETVRREHLELFETLRERGN